MPPKKPAAVLPKKPSTRPTLSIEQEEAKKVHQAVILADSFNERFIPITGDKPRCLLPLVNVPVIEYTLEFLALNGIEDVIVVCVSNAELIKEYLESGRWSGPTADMVVKVEAAPDCTSAGDALRYVDSKQLITDDFVLIYGDLISNMDLASVMDLHRARRKEDKSLIMTMILKQMSPIHRTRERCEGAVFAVDEASGDCVIYEPIDSERRTRTLKLDARLVETRRALALRYDLMDCQIDLCSPQVLALFTENFDWQDLRRDFVRGVLTSDILGNRIGTHVLRQEYAARIRNTRLYDAVSRDIIQRWTYPIVPDANIGGLAPLMHRRGHIYTGRDVVLSRTASVERGSVLGSGVTVGENTRISDCVIGPNCRIGDSVTLRGAYLFAGVHIGNRCVVEQCILSDDVHVKDDSVVAPGCLIAGQVTIGPHARLPARTRVAKWSEHIDLAMSNLALLNNTPGGGSSVESSDRSIELLAASSTGDENMLGAASDGIIWRDIRYDNGYAEEAEEKDEELEAEHLDAFTIGSTILTSQAVPNDEDEDSSQSDSDLSLGSYDDAAIPEVPDSATATGNSKKSHGFLRESRDILSQCLASSVSLDNTSLELNSLKFAWNASFAECRFAILEALVVHNLVDCDDLGGRVKATWNKWSKLLAKFTHSEADQLQLLTRLTDILKQQAGGSSSSANPLRTLQFIVPILYKEDVLDEDAIREWYNGQTAIGDASPHSQDALLRAQVRPFIDWLDTQSSDDENSE